MSNSKQPGHYTEHGTRKFQANGPVAWIPVFRAAAGKDQTLGDGIRAAMAYAALHRDQFLAWAKSHTDAWERAPSAPVGARGKRKAPAPAPRKSKPRAPRKAKQLELATEAKS